MYKESTESVLERITEEDIVEIDYFNSIIPDEDEFDSQEEINGFLTDKNGVLCSIIGYVYSDVDKDDRYINIYQRIEDNSKRRPIKILISSILEIRILN